MSAQRTTWLAWGLLAAAGALVAPANAQQPDSIWYHERGTQPRPLPEGSTRLDTALRLAAVLRDGRVPGFYDGQFAGLKERFDDLASIAGDPDMNHVLRVVAVMALQEAGDGERVRAVLEPLLVSPEAEFTTQYMDRSSNGDRDDEGWIQDVLVADLSQHARFALAKDGQPAQVLRKIRVMEYIVQGRMHELLDPNVRSDEPRWAVRAIFDDRMTLFEIGYHYQQFDDYAHATEWFKRLTDNLPGHRETQMAHYNLACIEALSGRPEPAMEHLRQSHAVGFTNVAWLQEDGDLASLRGRDDFAALVALMRNQEAPAGPSPGDPLEDPAGEPDERAPDSGGNGAPDSGQP